ncbi:MAG TPA: BrnT family toxin [Thermoanaerobaculia bacterium]|nr:BrnT family toxin [Thermoanaerobaculia bacterium]
MKVEWDHAKNLENQRKHGVRFEEASELFRSGVDYLEIFDDEHSVGEDRFMAVGPIRRGLVLIVWTERNEETIRIISARWTTEKERALYRSYREDRNDRHS